ncbi:MULTISPECIES: hypothetical protein [Streptomyces]|uniref:hypothetical protein n=1 Tax=Streptomyces TaxID=1883 RepID=UPI00207AD9C4|nr:hypothetical protein [Streptomyces nojiriensis]MCM9078007.1 hypothetical protein [Streptomyces spororaveus]
MVNVASTAAFQPTAYFAVYGASKTFVLNFSLALATSNGGAASVCSRSARGRWRPRRAGPASVIRRNEARAEAPEPMQHHLCQR